jgi:hypothetical protein
MRLLPEPTSHTDDADEIFTTTEAVLAFVRAEAAKRDPANATRYATASAASIKDGVDLARRVLTSHLTTTHFLERPQPRRRGRRATPDPALQEQLALVLALGWLEAAFGLLPPSRPPESA